MRTVAMPQLGLGSEEVVVTEWLVKVGETFSIGTPLVTIDTDKASMEVEAPFAGVVAEILQGEGSVVTVGEPILYALEGSEHEAGAENSREARLSNDAEAVEEVAAAIPPPTSVGPALITPDSRRVSQDSDERASASTFVEVECGELAGLPDRVEPLRPLEARPRALIQLDDSTLSGPYVERELSRKRVAIGRRLARDIPVFSISRDVGVAGAMATVRAARDRGAAATLTDVLVRACAFAAKKLPHVNAWFVDGIIQQFEHVGIGLAVDTPDGVVAPVVRKAETLDVSEMAVVREDLVRRTRAGSVRMQELVGATMSLSNVGALGAHVVVPVITLPQVAVLGVGTARPDGFLTCTFVGDHRALDGADGARFLALFERALAVES